MGTNLACTAIGLPAGATTNKVVNIGGYVQSGPGDPGPTAWGAVIGVNGSTYFTRRAPPIESVDPPFLVPSDSGVVAGKNARLVTTAGIPLVVPADGLCNVSLTGEVTAAAGVGLYKCYVTPLTTIPAFTGLWVFEV